MSVARRELLLGGLALTAATMASGALAAPAFGMSRWKGGEGLPDWLAALAEARLWPWEQGQLDEIEAARRMNPEFDLMSRTFLAMALGDLALADPDRWKGRAIRALDTMIADTTRAVDDRGPAWFLLPYWGHRDSRGERRSLFVDGERLLVMGIRRVLAEEAALAAQSRDLADVVARIVEAGPCKSAESYPNECWTFCNSLALAALRVCSFADGDDRFAPLGRSWLAHARSRLIEPDTGLLVSSFAYDGQILDGPEGSSIWLVSHMLRLIDPGFGAEQFALARAALGRRTIGLGWAREWPRGHRGEVDVDSGPIIPLMGASTSSSGLAILAARSYGDVGFERSLVRSLQVAAFPAEKEGRRRFLASNVVGDAVILAGCTAGPLWDLVGGTIAA